MKLLPILEKLKVPPEIGLMLPRPSCATIARPTPDIAKLTLKLLERLGLQGVETLLVSECARAVGHCILAVADMCRASRVSVEDVEAHAHEIGVACQLRPAMMDNVRRFVQFMRLMEKMGVMRFSGRIEGRTLLGFKAFEVLEAEPWRAVLDAVVGVRYFTSKGAVYDALLLFGFGQIRRTAKFEHPPGPVLKRSTDKKLRALEYGRVFFYSQKKLKSNLKRYTNGHTSTKLLVSPDALHALLAAARQAACDEKMSVAFVCV